MTRDVTADAYGDAAGPRPDAKEILSAARRCTWALTNPDSFLASEASGTAKGVQVSGISGPVHGGGGVVRGPGMGGVRADGEVVLNAARREV